MQHHLWGPTEKGAGHVRYMGLYVFRARLQAAVEGEAGGQHLAPGHFEDCRVDEILESMERVQFLGERLMPGRFRRRGRLLLSVLAAPRPRRHQQAPREHE